MGFITAKIDGNGLLNVTGTSDWARGGQGGENIEANAILYQALTGGVTLANVEGDTRRRDRVGAEGGDAEVGREQPPVERARSASTATTRPARCIRRTATRWPSGTG